MAGPLASDVRVGEGDRWGGWVAWLVIQPVYVRLAHWHSRVDVLAPQQPGRLLPPTHGALGVGWPVLIGAVLAQPLLLAGWNIIIGAAKILNKNSYQYWAKKKIYVPKIMNTGY